MRLIFVFLFFYSSAQATVFPAGQDLFSFNKDEVRNPYNFMIPSPFKEEVVSKAVKLLEQKSSEALKYRQTLQLFYRLSPSQTALILNERRLLLGASPDWNEIPAEELKSLYENPNVKKIIDFIVKNELSSKQILIFIFPFLRDQSLKSGEMIEILKSVSFDVNTMLKGEDLISLFMDSSVLGAKDSISDKIVVKPAQDLLIPDSKELMDSLEQAHSLLFPDNQEGGQSLSSRFNEKGLNEKEQSADEALKQLQKIESELLAQTTDYYSPEIALVSLAHLAMAHKEEGLIKFLYQNKDFNPNALNHIDQTPLHSLFLSPGLSSANSKKLSRKSWERLLGLVFDNPKVNWNARDIHGLSPLAIAISKSLTEALPALFEIKDIDVGIKDNYNRSLVIIASQSLPKENKKNLINILIKKGGDKLVMPSHFNDYIDENLNPITIQHNHPLKDVIFQAFSIIKESKKNRSNQVIASLADYDYKLRQSLKAKRSLIESISQSKSSYYQQPVIQAIKTDDSGFFEKFYSSRSDIKKFVEHIFIFPFKNLSQTKSSDFLERINYIPSYHLLLLAIRENSPRVVQFFLESVANPYIFQPDKKEISFYMDILSETLIQSFRLSFENLSSKEEFEREQKKNRKIISAVMSNEKVDLEFKNFMDLTPMEIAFLTGQLEKVKALEDRDISLPEGDLWDTGISYLDIVERQGFKKASDYFKEKNKIQDATCYSHFIN